MKRASIIVLLLLAVSLLIRAGEPAKHPIDVQTDRCMETDSSTHGMLTCLSTAYERWDKELNANYSKLMEKLDPEGKRTLKAAQLAWLKYRDSEFKLLDQIYSKLDGTMYLVMRSADRVEIVRKRAMELASHLDTLIQAE